MFRHSQLEKIRKFFIVTIQNTSYERKKYVTHYNEYYDYRVYFGSSNFVIFGVAINSKIRYDRVSYMHAINGIALYIRTNGVLYEAGRR